jgi:3-oxoadipate enol-lactonase
VAQALAIRHPEAVRALGLVDTTAYYGPEGPSSWAQRAAQARDGGMASLTQFQLDRWFSDGFREVRPDLCAAVLDLFAATDLAGYTEACTALGAMDLREALGDVRCPTVVVVGEHDPATPPAHSEEIARRVPGARLAVLPGGKHLTAVERPLAVLAQMTDLLDA